MRYAKVAAAASALLLASATVGQAAPYHFAGLYAGVHGGYTHTESEVGSSDFSDDDVIGGLQFGYNFITQNGLMYGVETDFELNGADPSGSCPISRGGGSCDVTMGIASSARLRAGYAVDNFLLYATGGIAGGRYSLNTYDNNGNKIDDVDFGRYGWTVGAGVEMMLGDMVSMRLEYRYTDFASDDFKSWTNGKTSVDADVHAVMVGVNWFF